MKYINPNLTDKEYNIIVNKSTEYPFTGKYLNYQEEGKYFCKNCNVELYSSDDKFDSNCGWPSFDDELNNSVEKIKDKDGIRTEIICKNCKAHLGHIFYNEGFTEKNTRHCVNSSSLDFSKNSNIKSAIFASGCFWGTEYMFQQLNGVISTKVGYTGGNIKNPTYEMICYENTGHAEAVEIEYNSNIISYEELVKYFFETHDQSQINRQGPDIGEQYRSEIFYTTLDEKKTALSIIEQLKSKGFKVATKVTEAKKFYKAEDYHQNYYNNKGTLPYCHSYIKKFK